MPRIKSISPDVVSVARSLRQSRRVSGLTLDDAASLLRITPNELFEYERGTILVPRHVLEHLCIMGYKMMHARILERRYISQRGFCYKIKQTAKGDK